jgi:hypothetical protein
MYLTIQFHVSYIIHYFNYDFSDKGTFLTSAAFTFLLPSREQSVNRIFKFLLAY